MTEMPELVALFNGFGGLASLLVGLAEYYRAKISNNLLESVLIEELSSFTATVIVLTILIGGITFTGSIMRGVNFQASLADVFTPSRDRKPSTHYLPSASLRRVYCLASSPATELARGSHYRINTLPFC